MTFSIDETDECWKWFHCIRFSFWINQFNVEIVKYAAKNFTYTRTHTRTEFQSQLRRILTLQILHRYFIISHEVFSM